MDFFFLILEKGGNLFLYVLDFFSEILFFCLVDYLRLEERVSKYENYFLVFEIRFLKRELSWYRGRRLRIVFI